MMHILREITLNRSCARTSSRQFLAGRGWIAFSYYEVCEHRLDKFPQLPECVFISFWR